MRKRITATAIALLVIGGCRDFTEPNSRAGGPRSSITGIADGVLEYTVRDLSQPGWAWSYTEAINNNGQVVGEFDDGHGNRHAFLWDPLTGPRDLGTLPGGLRSRATAINDKGRVVGESEWAGVGTHSFVWDLVSGMQDVGMLGLSGINNLDQAVGTHSVLGTMQALLWDPEIGVQDLGGLTGPMGWSAGIAINNLGQVVGISDAICSSWGGYAIHPFLFGSSGTMQNLATFLPPEDEVSCHLDMSYPEDINDLGQVVGWYHWEPLGEFAFVWSPGPPPTVHLFNGGGFTLARKINNLGQVLGYDFNLGHTMLWTPGPGGTYDTRDLSTLPGCSNGGGAHLINDFGQLAGECEGATPGSPHATLWTPVTLNRPPLASLVVTPSITVVGSQITLDASGSTDPDGDALTFAWDFDDGNTGTGAIATHVYSQAGVYEPTVAVTDGRGGSATSLFQYVVEYDPVGGFATGAGWIDSPGGACRLAECSDATAGKAMFGFVSRYQKGATTPTGTTEFQFKDGGLRFTSESYQWFVVSGPQAQFKGTGTVNGAAGYGFLLTARDGDQPGGGGEDRFRIKIWDANGTVVYDNQMGAADNSNVATALGGGQIQIHP